jgi:hypothetical protein
VKGIITVQAINIATGEVELEHTQTNILNDLFAMHTLVNGNRLSNMSVAISDAIYKPSAYSERTLRHNTEGFGVYPRSGEILGVPTHSYIDDDANTKLTSQYTGRFNPPPTGSTRTIRSVLLRHINNDIIDMRELFAFTELNIPCVQTDSQYYDIYYRLVFDYTETLNGLPYDTYKNILKDITARFEPANVTSSFPAIKNRPGDNFIFSPGDRERHYGNGDISSLAYIRKKFYNISSSDGVSNYNFQHRNGSIIASCAHIYKAWHNGELSNVDLYKEHSKIQNVFGYREDIKSETNNNYLDIDNLATGSGKVLPTGDWQNEEPHVDDSLYYKTDFARRCSILITNSGNVGTSTYRLAVQPFIKTTHITTEPSAAQHALHISGLLSIEGAGTSSKRGLLGDFYHDDGNYTEAQFSAMIAYDGSSVLIPKRDKILLYSIPASKYWFINGGFTAIHQLAVRDGVIYIACRNTGLWTVNPRVSLTATKVTVTGYRTANFDVCHGVAIGYDNKLWAVGADALASYNGSVWTLYDETTTNPFIPSDYAHINFLLVDKAISTDQMLFVYNNSNPAVGFWWSTGTPVSIGPVYQPHGSEWGGGYCKKNKTHIVGINGHWLYNISYRTTFGSSTTTYLSGNYRDYGSFSKNIVYYNGVYYNYKTIYSDNQQGSNYTGVLINLDGSMPSPIIKDFSFNALDTDYYYSGIDRTYAINILLDDGVMFNASIQKRNQGPTPYACYFRATVYNIGLDKTPHGGDYRGITRKEYGWNGSSWELDHVGSKNTHASPEPLYNGVNIAFEDGVSGTSFVNENLYKFVLCQGVLKDNATRLSMKIPVFITRTETGVAPLESSTVPAVTALPTGLVGIHPIYKSKDVFIDGDGCIAFPGNNTGQFAVGDKQVTGDFEIQITHTGVNDPLKRGMIIGLGKINKTALPLVSILFENDDSRYFSSWMLPVNNSSTSIESYQRTSYLPGNIHAAGAITSIRRLGGVIEILKDGVVIHTYPSTLIDEADERLDIIYFSNGHDWNHLLANKRCYPVTIVTNGSDNAVKIGNKALGTEGFDMNCKMVVPDAPIVGKLNGIEVPVKVNGGYPAADEIRLDTDSLTLTFNPADQGKTIEIDCTRLWNR